MNQKESTIARVGGTIIIASGIVLALIGLVLLPAWYGVAILICGILGTCSGAVILIAQRRLACTTDKSSGDAKDGAA